MSALASGSVAATIVGLVTQRRASRIQQEIKLRFDQLAARATSQQAWKERAVADLLGPVHMQLDRTGRAFQRWNAGNLYVEARVIREAIMASR